jgi:hypothetical protein
MASYRWIGLGIVSLALCGCQKTAQTTAPEKAAAAGDRAIKDNGDGTVTDKKTGLMWQEDITKEVYMTWPAAQKYCRGLSLAGRQDWILPKKDQLVSLWNDGGFRSSEDDFTWSSEIDPGMQVFGGSFAWIVNSKDGSLSHAPVSESNENFLNLARCVRPGK